MGFLSNLFKRGSKGQEVSYKGDEGSCELTTNSSGEVVSSKGDAAACKKAVSLHTQDKLSQSRLKTAPGECKDCKPAKSSFTKTEVGSFEERQEKEINAV